MSDASSDSSVSSESVVLPSPASVTNSESFASEIDRCFSFLSSLDTDWNIRVWALQRIAALGEGEYNQSKNTNGDYILLSLLLTRNKNLLVQLSDRRSSVAKQATSTLASLSDSIQKLSQSLKTSAVSESYELLLSEWITELLPMSAITIAVIASAAVSSLLSIVDHAGTAAFSVIPSPFKSKFISQLAEFCTYKHASVRAAAFRSMVVFLKRFHRQAKAAERVLTAETRTSGTELPSTAYSSIIPAAIRKGVSDSDEKTRAAARQAAVLWRFIDESATESIVKSMNASTKKLYEKTMNDMEHALRVRGKAADDAPILPLSDDDQIWDDVCQQLGEGGFAVSAPSASSSLSKSKGKSSIGGGKANRAKLRRQLAKKGTNDIKIENELLDEGLKDENDEEENDQEENKEEKQTAPASTPSSSSSSSTSSDDSSDASQQEIHKKYTEDGIDPMSTTGLTSGEESVARHRFLITRLLDLDAPVLSEKMLTFLMHRGRYEEESVLGTFLSFLNRLPPNTIPWNKMISKEQERKELSAAKSKKGKAVPLVSEPAAPLIQFPTDPPILRRRERPNENDTEELSAMKRSYNVMQLLISVSDDSILPMLARSMRTIVLRVLSTFHPLSQGNIYHACAILKKFLLTFPNSFAQVITSDYGKQFFPLLFLHFHETPVMEFVCMMLTGGDQGDDRIKSDQDIPGDQMQRLRSFITLFNDSKPWEVLGSLLYSDKTNEETCLAISEFVRLLLEKAGTYVDLVFLLFGNVCQPRSLVSAAVKVLFLENKAAYYQRNAALSILNSLSAACEHSIIDIPDMEAAGALASLGAGELAKMPTKKATNPLFVIRQPLANSLKAILPKLFSSLFGLPSAVFNANAVNDAYEKAKEAKEKGESKINEMNDNSSAMTAIQLVKGSDTIQFSSYTVDSVFTAARLSLLQLIVKIVTFDETNLRIIPFEAWNILIQWFFIYKHNNFLQSAFRTLIVTAIRFGHHQSNERPLRLIFHSDSADLLTKMIHAYNNELKDKPTTINAFIIEICNHLRLSSQLMPPSAFLPHFLSSHSVWIKFLPLLKEETRRQTTQKFTVPEQDNGDGLSALLNILKGQSSKQLNAVDEKKKYGQGIDIGSKYAYGLGYKEFVPYGKTLSNNNNNNNNSNESETAAEGIAKKKRKKKKKNKKKKKLSNTVDESATESGTDSSTKNEAESDGEDGDDEDH